MEDVQVLDPSSNTVRTIAGSGKPGLADGAGTSAQLSEPGGLCLGPDGSVLVADTNNSAIRCCTCHYWNQGDMCSYETSGSAWMQCYLCAVRSCVYNRIISQSLAASALAQVGVCSWLTLKTASSGAARTLPKFCRCEWIAIYHDKQQQDLITCSPLELGMASACASLRKL